MSSRMCDNTVWGANYCGNGVCGASGQCICNAGWTHDRSFFKSDACWLPQDAMTVVEGIVGFSCLLVVGAGLVFVTKLRNHARKFAVLATTAALFGAAYMLSHFLEGNTHGPASIVFMILTIGSLSNAFAIALYSLLKTVWQFAGGDVNKLRRTVITVQVAEGSAFVLCAIIMIVGVATGDDKLFTMALASWVLVLSVHFAVLLYCIYVPTTEVVNMIVTSSSVEGERSTTISLNTKRLVRRLKQFIFFSKILGPPIVLVCLACALLCFVTGSVPFIWVMYLIILLQIPALASVQLRFAKPDSSNAWDKATSSTNSAMVADNPMNKSSAMVSSVKFMDN